MRRSYRDHRFGGRAGFASIAEHGGPILVDRALAAIGLSGCAFTLATGWRRRRGRRTMATMFTRGRHGRHGWLGGMARWIDAGGPHQAAFMGAASRTLRGERDIECPKCGAARLRSYFHMFNTEKRTGTIWVWCPACRTTGHLPRVTPTVDLGPDPFGSLSLEQFAALELDRDEPLLDRLDRLASKRSR